MQICSYESEEIHYLPSEKTTKTMRSLDIINRDNSSGAIVLKIVRLHPLLVLVAKGKRFLILRSAIQHLR